MTDSKHFRTGPEQRNEQFWPLHILCEDGPVIAINKPAGLLTQGGPPGNPDTVTSLVKRYLKEKYDKTGNVYLGVPHRLDRPVTGVLVLARNSKAAARLAEQFRERKVRKVYWAVVEGIIEVSEGEFTDWLVKHPDKAHVEVADQHHDESKECRLRYRTISVVNGHEGRFSVVEVELLTGRSHQIRVQFSSRGHPIVGDVQYGATYNLPMISGSDNFRERPIALHAQCLTILHPIRYDELTIEAPPPTSWGKWMNADVNR
ncbi:MAG: RNA pseudouridine synthase [Planctomycetota bacterium]|nr:RNA pseudouridine synthase [Planctomycetota bacterium]MDA1211412.1 RNA pseudouridine synthase [Planctomycetota bacterium]